MYNKCIKISTLRRVTHDFFFVLADTKSIRPEVLSGLMLSSFYIARIYPAPF